MKIIGVIIGTEDEPVSKEYYKKNKKILECLEEYDIYPDYIPYDFAIFAEIKHQGGKEGFNVIPLFGNDKTGSLIILGHQAEIIFEILLLLINPRKCSL